MAPEMLLFAAYVLVINMAGFLAFAWDKHCARNGMWRVPERALLSIAAVGGTIGALVGQRALRHKTSKEPFRTYLFLIAGLQAFWLFFFCFPNVLEGARSFVFRD
ncbi:DUF1294 domain-containing protein [Mesorhizobium sp. AaZ16]|uniref:DUF1294 domain-containing protein n=1 Tax=Mesorhizobium sp. AaZ16 TaxID=3402289 RepID=UPI00374F8402